jgi:hypothetical protein
MTTTPTVEPLAFTQQPTPASFHRLVSAPSPRQKLPPQRQHQGRASDASDRPRFTSPRKEAIPRPSVFVWRLRRWCNRKVERGQWSRSRRGGTMRGGRITDKASYSRLGREGTTVPYAKANYRVRARCPNVPISTNIFGTSVLISTYLLETSVSRGILLETSVSRGILFETSVSRGLGF